MNGAASGDFKTAIYERDTFFVDSYIKTTCTNVDL